MRRFICARSTSCPPIRGVRFEELIKGSVASSRAGFGMTISAVWNSISRGEGGRLGLESQTRRTESFLRRSGRWGWVDGLRSARFSWDVVGGEERENLLGVAGIGFIPV